MNQNGLKTVGKPGFRLLACRLGVYPLKEGVPN